MVHAKYRKYFISIEHVWFNQCSSVLETLNELNSKSEICFLHSCDFFITDVPKYCVEIEQNTLITDLTQTKESIFQKINKNYRYEIRRCEKENIVVKNYNSKEILKNSDIFEKFITVYNDMYKSKGLKTTFNKELMKAYIMADMVVFSAAFFDNEPLVFHSYIVGDETTRFFYSASPFRSNKYDASLIGRMNKYLHWNDLLYFKDIGVQKYDWGGIGKSLAVSGISQFKMKFSGDKSDVCTYQNIIVGNNWLGKIILMCYKVLK